MERSQISGIIENCIYGNEKNGYGIVNLSMEDGSSVTVVGCLPFAGEGEWLTAVGSFVIHPKYGSQFKAELVKISPPVNRAGMVLYLSSSSLPGIGAATAMRIVSEFGEDTFEVIKTDPERLGKIKGVGLSKARRISEAFSGRLSIRSLMEFLHNNGLRPELALMLAKVYGRGAMEELIQNPYILCAESFGQDFPQVDEIAQDMGIESTDIRRISAGIFWVLQYNAYEGHVFLPKDKLVLAAANSCGAEEELISNALSTLIQNEQLICESIAGFPAVYLPSLYEAERYVASRIFDMSGITGKAPSVEDEIAEQEEKQGIVYAEKQKRAISAAMSGEVLILTGGPGTGKTTTVRAMLGLFDRRELTCSLAAPTGRAAKRLSELCGRESKTIHRLLEVSADREAFQMTFIKNENNPLESDVVIVDEMSMVDLPLFASLLRAIKPGTRLIMVGDPDQLPPVGPGCALKDMLRSDVVPYIHLDEIFRQAQKSNIITSAHSINRGEMPDLTQKRGDFYFISRGEGEKVCETIVDLCKNRLPTRMGIPPSKIQVISPSRRYECGTQVLNRMLQAALNPPSPEKREFKAQFCLFRQGDRVMQIKNNYDLQWFAAGGKEAGLGVFNGDVGTIDSISNIKQSLTVRFEDDRLCEYEFDQAQELELAYAVTVHKAQGSEFPAVIFAALISNPRLCNRSLYYTAVTRARDLLVTVGRADCVAAMVRNVNQYKRYSGLKTRLQNT